MKKLFSALLLMIACTGILCISSCKKKDKEKITLQKLQGKWKVVSFVANFHDLQGDHPSPSDPVNATDSYDFNTDGKVYITKSGVTNSYPYTFTNYAATGENKVEFLQVSWTIQTLTDTALKLYHKRTPDPSKPDDFQEYTINLSK